MQLPRLDIHNTFAVLGLDQSRATIEIRQPKADVKMSQPQPEIEMNKTKGKLTIDQSEAFADANLKHPFRVVKERAEASKQKILEGIAEEAAEGERLMKIENQSTTVIPQIAKEESETPPKQFNIGFMPASVSHVKISYTPSEVDIKVHEGDLHIKITPNEPMIKFIPGNLQIYLKQKASMQIQAVGPTLDQKI